MGKNFNLTNRYNKNSIFSLSANQVKVIAMITMLIDHIGLMLIGNGKLYGYDNQLYSYVIALNSTKNWVLAYKFCRTIGRISFPLYAYFIVEGFLRTNNLFKYYLRLLALAIISEIPFDLMVQNKFFSFEGQNVIWTYLLGLMVISFFHLFETKFRNKVVIFFLKLLVFAIGCAGAFFLKTDYSFIGVILMTFLYLTKNDRDLMLFGNLIISGAESIERFGMGGLSTLFIYLYNGKKGTLDLSKIFYLFYPVHMLILYLIVYFSYLGR